MIKMPSFGTIQTREQIVLYAIRVMSVRPSVHCDHTVPQIETILVSLERPTILVSEKVSLVNISQ